MSACQQRIGAAPAQQAQIETPQPCRHPLTSLSSQCGSDPTQHEEWHLTAPRHMRERYTAKDPLRASALPLLPRDESHVEGDLKRISKGKPLSPVLLIQGDMSKAVPPIIADGYHRICAVCYYDEDAAIDLAVTCPDIPLTPASSSAHRPPPPLSAFPSQAAQFPYGFRTDASVSFLD